MKINVKELWVFFGCLAVIVTTHAELLTKLPEWAKDLVTLVALAVVAMREKVVTSHEQ